MIIAFSVLTHMRETTQAAWLAHFFELLRPGGILLLSLHGDATIGWLSRSQRRRFLGGEVIVSAGREEFKNICCAYHPPAAVRRMISAHFDVQHFESAGATANAPQDLWVLRRRPDIS